MIARIEWTQEIFDAMPKTRDEAIRVGSVHFFPARPCANGHVAARAVKGYVCVLCRRDKVRTEAEKRRRRRGQKIMKPTEPPAAGSSYACLTATGQISRPLRNRWEGDKATMACFEVVCDCGNVIWIRAEQWQVQKTCKTCRKRIERTPAHQQSKRNYRHGLSRTIAMWLWHSAKKRARDANRPFTLCITDIDIPDHCPVLGIALDPVRRGDSGNRAPRPNAPSLDRINSAGGYTPDNVAVISHRANNLKKDGTAQEHELIAAFMDARGVEG